jgi:hypothetical protein
MAETDLGKLLGEILGEKSEAEALVFEPGPRTQRQSARQRLQHGRLACEAVPTDKKG